MRVARILGEGEAFYHILSRIVDRRLTTYEVLHCRVRYFSDGMILGSREFVEATFGRCRGNFGVQRDSGARRMRGARWKHLCVARRLQLAPVSAAAVC